MELFHLAVPHNKRSIYSLLLKHKEKFIQVSVFDRLIHIERQKLVLQLDMSDEKRRSKALKTVVGAEGVFSVALDEKDKRKLVVIGEDMDAFELVTSLRMKNLGVDMECLEEVKREKGCGGGGGGKRSRSLRRRSRVNYSVHPAANYDTHIQPDPNCSIM